jgi:hypothetical protein
VGLDRAGAKNSKSDLSPGPNPPYIFSDGPLSTTRDSFFPMKILFFLSSLALATFGRSAPGPSLAIDVGTGRQASGTVLSLDVLVSSQDLPDPVAFPFDDPRERCVEEEDSDGPQFLSIESGCLLASDLLARAGIGREAHEFSPALRASTRSPLLRC